jgi:hypothetical protein
MITLSSRHFISARRITPLSLISATHRRDGRCDDTCAGTAAFLPCYAAVPQPSHCIGAVGHEARILAGTANGVWQRVFKSCEVVRLLQLAVQLGLYQKIQ